MAELHQWNGLNALSAGVNLHSPSMVDPVERLSPGSERETLKGDLQIEPIMTTEEGAWNLVDATKKVQIETSPQTLATHRRAPRFPGFGRAGKSSWDRRHEALCHSTEGTQVPGEVICIPETDDTVTEAASAGPCLAPRFP